MFNDILNERAKQPTSNEPVANLSADWFDVDDSWKPQIPEGDYVVKVSSYKLHQSKNDPTSLGFMWTLTVVEGEHSGKDFTHYTWLGRTDGNGNFTKKEDGRGFRLFLQALGVTPKTRPDLMVNGAFTLTEEAVINNMVKVSIVHERVLRNDAKGKPQHELTNDDYMTNLKVNRVYPVEPAGKKFVAGNII